MELDVEYIEGFAHVGKLRECFDRVPERMELQSRVSPAVTRIGQRVRVRVASVDPAARRIELGAGVRPGRDQSSSERPRTTLSGKETPATVFTCVPRNVEGQMGRTD